MKTSNSSRLACSIPTPTVPMERPPIFVAEGPTIPSKTRSWPRAFMTATFDSTAALFPILAGLILPVTKQYVSMTSPAVRMSGTLVLIRLSTIIPVLPIFIPAFSAKEMSGRTPTLRMTKSAGISLSPISTDSTFPFPLMAVTLVFVRTVTPLFFISSSMISQKSGSSVAIRQ